MLEQRPNSVSGPLLYGKTPYMNRSNLEYLETVFAQYKADPSQVTSEWRHFFEGMEYAGKIGVGADPNAAVKEIHVYHLIQAYRDYGHLKADLDPLGMHKPDEGFFKLEKFGLSEADLDTVFAVASVIGADGSSLREIIARLEKAYCGRLATQVADCRPEVAEWFRKEFENPASPWALTPDEKKEVFHELARTESLERFIHTRFVGVKRFSIEGGDALIPMLERVVKTSADFKTEEIVIGMAHRGRINVLANFMNKALNVIFAEFDGIAKGDHEYEGDVKYHLGYSCDKETPKGSCHISLAFNPSHLEVVSPVVTGMARAKQRRRLDTETRKKVLPIIIHGDAAFAGQGVVAETLQMSRLPGYTVGGSIHIIINNQVGFTTDPDDARSTLYASDAAKVIKAPILMVNGDDVEACLKAIDLATRFRHQFGEDVVIDLICYRRFGHNEGDEPAFTQPVMYEKIKNHPTLSEIYSQQLMASKVFTEDYAKTYMKSKIDNLQAILEETRKNPPEVKPKAFEGLWKGLRRAKIADFDHPVKTGVSKELLAKCGTILTTEPKDIALHPKMKKLIQTRHELLQKGKVDWAMAELLSYGSLCLEGTPVRLSGQDVKRGTFTHRQAVYFDIHTNRSYCPLAELNPKEGEFVIYNSLLSEMAVLGFEYGNASSDPTYLTIWEAQFGDFANGAQIIIDQFIASGELKWARGCGLVLLLPHGYEGQGPEHSSARLERFLQLCAQQNMQVCNITTPANLFHVLRRQVRRDFRKPLVIMSPKSLLRHPKVISGIEELSFGHFQEVLDDPYITDPKMVETLILCSGKLYYDLDKAREEKYRTNSVAIIRMEQLYPFPKVQLTPFLNGYSKLKRVIWAQEEPANMGAYSFVAPKIDSLLKELGQKRLEIEYVGRTDRASPATGSPKVHAAEQEELIAKAFA